jgi:YHS domain-containing protein
MLSLGCSDVQDHFSKEPETMKLIIALTGLMLGTAAVAVAMRSDTTPVAGPATQPVNKMCAVESEHPIDVKHTYEYKGKLIGFCCGDCIPEFKKDPEKYMKNLK